MTQRAETKVPSDLRRLLGRFLDWLLGRLLRGLIGRPLRRLGGRPGTADRSEGRIVYNSNIRQTSTDTERIFNEPTMSSLEQTYRRMVESTSFGRLTVRVKSVLQWPGESIAVWFPRFCRIGGEIVTPSGL